MIRERFVIPVLSRFKVRILKQLSAHSLRVRFNTRYLWIGLHASCEHPDRAAI